jgi:two-component system sensor histidine kinase RstB
MIRLFIKFFLLIILVQLGSKWAFEKLFERQVAADRERVITSVHLGGMRMIAQQLLTTPDESREAVFTKIERLFRAPLELRPLSELDSKDREELDKPYGYLYRQQAWNIDLLAIPYDDQQYLQIGPFIDYTTIAIEDSLWGWLRLLAFKLDSETIAPESLSDLSRAFGLPIVILPQAEVPEEAMDRFRVGRVVAFYRHQEKYFAATKMASSNEYLRLGPIPEFQETSRNAAKTTLTSSFLLSAILVGLLVHSLSKKFNSIEQTAQAIARGDLSARANESKAGETRYLAKALNLMAERTESMIRSKRELLQMVSHELRTPLARLRFAVDLLETKVDDEKRDRRMEIIHHSIDELELVVSEILDYVRNNEEFVVRSQDWIDVPKAIEPVLKVIAEETPNLTIECVPCQVGQSPLVYADRISFLRVAKNIAGNAQRYARTRLVIRVYQVTPPRALEPDGKSLPMQSMTCVEFEDDGPGIPQDKWHEVTEPFVRISETGLSNATAMAAAEPRRPLSPKNYSGIGLGLAIVSRILKQHGGSMQIARGELGGCLVRTFWPNPSSQVPMI